MADVTIHGIPQSNFVWTARLAAHEKGVANTLDPITPGPDAVRAGHPLGRVPVLSHGALRIGESRAIAGYIDAAFDGPPLLPKDPADAAAADAIALMIITAAEPVLVRRHIFAFIFPGTADGAPDFAKVEAASADVARHLGFLEGLADDGHVLGATPAFADLWLAPILFYLRMLPTWADMAAAHPRLAAAADRALARDSIAATTPPPLPD